MKTNNSSEVDLKKGTSIFHNEKDGFKAFIILVQSVTILDVVYLLKEWAIPAILAGGLNLPGFVKFGRSKLP